MIFSLGQQEKRLNDKEARRRSRAPSRDWPLEQWPTAGKEIRHALRITKARELLGLTI